MKFSTRCNILFLFLLVVLPKVDPVPGFTFKLYDGEHLREQFAPESMYVHCFLLLHSVLWPILGTEPRLELSGLMCLL